MSLEGFGVSFGDKRVEVEIDKEGFYSHSYSNLTVEEMQYISACLFVYLEGKRRGIILDWEYTFKKSGELLNDVHNRNSLGLKNICEMSEEEFREMLKEFE